MERTIVIPARERRTLAIPRVAVWKLLPVLVLASAAIRAAVAFARQTPIYFPDEYLYSELGRSIATSGRPLVRGVPATFPALLQPIATAPVWFIHDVATAYHVIQVENALVMSLAAVPAYLLARRSGVSEWLSLAVATLALVLPDLVYVGAVLSEPFAYPLALTGAYFAVCALERPTARAQLAFLGVSGLAGFARVQLLVLPLCFLVAAVFMGFRERQLLRVLRRTWIVGVVVAVAAGGLVFLAHGSVGQYGDVLQAADLNPGHLMDHVTTQALSLLYASGVVIVPGAVLGIVGAFARPRTRAELALAAFAVPFTVAMILQAAVWGDPQYMQERYSFYAVPVLAVGFAVHAGRGWPWWRLYGLISAAILVIAATVPLSGYAAAGGRVHSPVLFALTRLEEMFGSIGTGDLVFALFVSVAVVAAALLARTRGTAVLVPALAITVMAAIAAVATDFDLRYDAAVRKDYLPSDRSWVDHAGLADSAYVYTPGMPKEGLEQLFWNRSVKRVLLFPGAPSLDAYGADRLAFGRDGTLLSGGHPLSQPLLVNTGASVIELRGATRVATSKTYALWKPAGAPRVSYYANGWFGDDWLTYAGKFRVWAPRVSGHIRFVVWRDASEPPVNLRVHLPSGIRTFHVAPGTRQAIDLRACGTRLWRARFDVNQYVVAGWRILGLRATRPTWTADPSACT